MKLQKIKYLIPVFFFLGMKAYAQVQILNTKIDYKNDTLIWTLQFSVEEGFYVFSPEQSDEGRTSLPMKLSWHTIPDNLKRIGDAKWPPSGFSGMAQVFKEGTYTVQQVFLAIKKGKNTPAVLKGTLVFQGCREDSCYPPDERLFETRVSSLY